MICKKRVPEAWVADERRVDSDSTATAQGFVVLIARLLRGRTELEIALEARIGVAEDRDGGTVNSGVTLAKVCKRCHFHLGLRKNERRIKFETHIVDAKARDGDQPETSRIEFGGSRGANKKMKGVGGIRKTSEASVRRAMNRALFFVSHNRSA